MRLLAALLPVSLLLAPCAAPPPFCPPPSTSPLSRAQIATLARLVGFPASTAETMAAIALRESRGQPTALHRSSREHSLGLWQINIRGRLRRRLKLFGLRSPTELLDPYTNARAALVLWKAHGLQPWRAD